VELRNLSMPLEAKSSSDSLFARTIAVECVSVAALESSCAGI